MLVILKYTIFDLIIQDQVLDYDRPKKCPTILYGVNLWLIFSGNAGDIKQLLANCQISDATYAFTWLERAGLISSTMLCLLRFVYCMNYLHHIATYLPPPLYGTTWVH